MRVAAASDIHVATRWDSLQREARELFAARNGNSSAEAALWSRESFENSFLNPNENLASLIELVNGEAAERGLDALLAVGDLVDFKYHRDPLLGESGVEWSLLEQLLGGSRGERLRVPLFTSTGNHDYRLYPYKFQIYGLQHCGLDDAFTSEYLRRSKRATRLTYSPADLGSIAITRGRSHSLDAYYTALNPCDDYAVDLSGVRVVMLDTGPDVFCDLREGMGRRWVRYFENIGKIDDPNSASLSDEQIAFLRDALRGAGEAAPALVACHAPPLNPPKNARESFVDAALLDALGDGPPAFARSMAFEKHLSGMKLDAGVFFKNHFAFFDLLRRRAGAAAVVSGHNHWRLSGRLRKGAANGEIDLWQLPSVGHINRQDIRHGTPGFAVIEYDGMFKRIDRDVPTRAFDRWLYEWSGDPTAGGAQRITVHCQARAASGTSAAHRVSGFVRGWNALSLRVAAGEGVAVRSTSPASFAAESRRNVFSFDVTGLPRGAHVTFLFESFDACNEGRSYGLHRHHRELRAE